LLSEAFNDGPATLTADHRLDLLDGAVTLEAQIACERGEPTTMNCMAPAGPQPAGAADTGGVTYLQDTRDWFAHHLGSSNILMADGSVKNVVDTNGDGYLNPGFPVDPTTPGYDQGITGYADSVVEMSPTAFFNGMFIDDAMFKKRFEE